MRQHMYSNDNSHYQGCQINTIHCLEWIRANFTYRAVFNWVPKVIHDCVWFLCLTHWLVKKEKKKEEEKKRKKKCHLVTNQAQIEIKHDELNRIFRPQRHRQFVGFYFDFSPVPSDIFPLWLNLVITLNLALRHSVEKCSVWLQLFRS